MNIDLSKFVGKKVRVKTHDSGYGIGTIEFNSDSSFDSYQYFFKAENNPSLDGNTYTRDGYYFSDRREYAYNIVDISPSVMGQAHPHIDLSKLVGKEVYVVCKDKLALEFGFTDKLFGTVAYNGGNYIICGKCFTKNGVKTTSNKNNYIVEIYPEGAFEIITLGTENPIDPEVERAKELLKSLSSEQITAVIDSIRSSGKS